MKNQKNYSHPNIPHGKTGVLLVNLGTPKSTKWLDVRSYLKEFLSDRRVIEVNPVLWFFILNIIILTFRPAKTAKLYKKIWLKKENMSPLRYYTIKQSEKLAKCFNKKKIEINYAMRYGSPSIPERLASLQKRGCENIIILPLYPQYAAATSATVCDKVFKSLIQMRWQPSLQTVAHYESDPLYIKALLVSIKRKLIELKWTPDVIVASYHGIPQKYFDKGDPYHCYCLKTSRLLREGFRKNIPIISSFQSRFGPEKWLEPYTDETLKELPKKGKKKVLMICPGFASDCVETLEEISIEGKTIFLESGGRKFDVVPCLNDSIEHINLLKNIVKKYTFIK